MQENSFWYIPPLPCFVPHTCSSTCPGLPSRGTLCYGHCKIENIYLFYLISFFVSDAMLHLCRMQCSGSEMFGVCEQPRHLLKFPRMRITAGMSSWWADTRAARSRRCLPAPPTASLPLCLGTGPVFILAVHCVCSSTASALHQQLLSIKPSCSQACAILKAAEEKGPPDTFEPGGGRVRLRSWATWTRCTAASPRPGRRCCERRRRGARRRPSAACCRSPPGGTPPRLPCDTVRSDGLRSIILPTSKRGLPPGGF